jgi:hypothetical protein
MTDSVRITNLPDGGSPERVAFDLYMQLRVALPKKEDAFQRIEQHLALFSECRLVVRGEIPNVSRLK